MKRNAIIIDGQDNIATLLRDVLQGEEVHAGLGSDIITLSATQDIAFGHKVAVRDISEGSEILKYGCVIGQATNAIAPGEHVHVHNVVSLRGRGDLAS